MLTVGVDFTVHSNYGNERPAVCLKPSFETNFLDIRVIFAWRIDLIEPYNFNKLASQHM